MATITPSLTSALPGGYGVTVGTVNQAGCPPNPSRGGLWFYNNSATASIAVCPATLSMIASGATPFGANANTIPPGVVSPPAMGVAVVNGPGSITLTPGQAQIIDKPTYSLLLNWQRPQDVKRRAAS